MTRVLASLEAEPCNHDSIIAIKEDRSELDGREVLDPEAGPNSRAAG